MADPRLFAAFNGSPFFYVMLPFIGILLLVSAALSGYQLACAENKNFDKWFGFVVATVCSLLACVSMYGSVIATFLQSTFVAGPWFFLTSIVLAGVHQSIMLALNLYRAYESSPGSVQRMHYIQASFSNAHILALLTAISGTITFVMLTPVAPLLGSACALSVVLLTVMNLCWRMIPHNWKLAIKEHVYLNKPEVHHSEHLTQILTLGQTSDKTIFNSRLSQRLFSHTDYAAVVKAMNPQCARQYLKKVINEKIQQLCSQRTLQSDKNVQKKDVLSEILAQLDDDSKEIFKNKLLKRYPMAFQSFWAEKGEVEQIVDAVIGLRFHTQSHPEPEGSECEGIPYPVSIV